MSLNAILGSALSGLSASQAGLRTVSNNIANVDTPGYAREQVSLSSGVTAGRVSGVRVSEPSRVADRFLEAAVFRRSGDTGRGETAAGYLDRLQALLGAPGSETSLPGRLDAVAASAIAITAAPGSRETIAVFTDNVTQVVSSMQQLNDDVSYLRSEAETEIGYTVGRINELLGRIHDLNSVVARQDGLGRSSAGAGDQRRAAVEELSSFVAIEVRNQPDGRIVIDGASGVTLLDRLPRQLQYSPSQDGSPQPVYPAIEIRFANDNGEVGAATGERIDSALIGGRLGGLLDLRDRRLPEVTEQVGALLRGFAEAVNTASNAFSAVPAPRSLTGRVTGLTGADRIGFSGTAHFAVTDADNMLVAKTSIDFDALGPAATLDDVIAALNSGLAGAATATFSDGMLRLEAAPGTGVVVAQDDAVPSSRAGAGFAHFFGLNDLVGSEKGSLLPSGFTAADPHGFGAGETAHLTLRDASGRIVAEHTVTPTGPDFGDILADLNSSDLARYGSFSIDQNGRFEFQARQNQAGLILSIPSDSTDRYGTGRSFSELTSLGGEAAALKTAALRPEVAGNPSKVPLARLDIAASPGTVAMGAADIRGATALIDLLNAPRDIGTDGGVAPLGSHMARLLGDVGADAAVAKDALADAQARRSDAVNRRDSFSGVNIDEELAQMVVLQNSYSASARIVSTVGEMYDTLLAMTA